MGVWSSVSGGVPAATVLRYRGLRPHQTAYEGVAQHLPVVWVALRASMRHVLDGVTLADLVAGELPEHVRGLAEEPDAWLPR